MQGIDEYVYHLNALPQIATDFGGYVTEGLDLVISEFQAINVILVQFTISLLVQMDHLMVGNGKQIYKELMYVMLQCVDTCCGLGRFYGTAKREVWGKREREIKEC